MEMQRRRAVIGAALMLAFLVTVCCCLWPKPHNEEGSGASSLLQTFTSGLVREKGMYVDRLYGDKLAVVEDLARIDSLRGALQRSSSYTSRLQANLGTGERRLPSAFVLNGQQLAGWRAEQAELVSLEKKAEQRLKKDLSASDDSRSKAEESYVQGYNATGGKIEVPLTACVCMLCIFVWCEVHQPTIDAV
jgi:hypothetical protein